MRKHSFEIGEYYHIYNRGTDKRDIILDEEDLYRFHKSLMDFNDENPIGSIYEKQFKKDYIKSQKLIDIIAYCINPNHFHLIVTPLVNKGIEKFMQRLGGYTKYFNEKNYRSGALFQGKFKSKYLIDNRYLLHLSVYVNCNNRDQFGSRTSKLNMSSLDEYLSESGLGICNRAIVLDQFRNSEEYNNYCKETWSDVLKRKEEFRL